MKRTTNICIVILLNYLLVSAAFADRCSTAEEVRYRFISKDYEWSVDERMTLENLLDVEKLFAVRIMNRGEFVSCRYRTKRQLINLDGEPKKQKCVIRKSSGQWKSTKSGDLVCQEKDISLCLFDIEC